MRFSENWGDILSENLNETEPHCSSMSPNGIGQELFGLYFSQDDVMEILLGCPLDDWSYSFSGECEEQGHVANQSSDSLTSAKRCVKSRVMIEQ